jgi:hypothetical protein
MSAGRLTIKVYAGGELVPPLEVFYAVSRGTAELGHGAAYYWKGKVPAAQFFTAVPFGLSTSEMNAWLSKGGGQALWDEAYAPFGVKPVVMVHRPPGSGLVELIRLHKALQQRRPDKVFQRLQIRFIDTQLRERMQHRTGDAHARVGEGAIEVEENVLVIHG